MTYALLVPQSPYRIAAARGTFTLRGRLTLVVIKLLRLGNRGGVVRRRGPTSARAGIGPEPCLIMTLTRLAVGLEPLDAPDAAHRSPRSVPHWRTEVGSPVGSALAGPLSRTKNC